MRGETWRGFPNPDGDGDDDGAVWQRGDNWTALLRRQQSATRVGQWYTIEIITDPPLDNSSRGGGSTPQRTTIAGNAEQLEALAFLILGLIDLGGIPVCHATSASP